MEAGVRDTEAGGIKPADQNSRSEVIGVKITGSTRGVLGTPWVGTQCQRVVGQLE
jgi:hypothetical protein